ncbi:MAG: acyl-CoA synthetase [Proteobacteria bacterium]|nr:acyl-CoA synthetase [Pseudomonadota bacterium]
MADWHLATAYERISDTIGDQPALICNDVIRTWSEFDDRAARIARVLTNHGLGPDSKAGIYLHNSNEYLEAHHGICKLRACPVNVNYRYKEEELVYLLNNADAEALIYQAAYADRIAAIRDQLANITCLIQVADESGAPLLAGALDYEEVIRGTEPMERLDRRADDLYMLYTGGTTGMPKGVMYANGLHAQALGAFSARLGVTPSATVEDLAGNISDAVGGAGLPVGLVCCPLMHGTGMWVGSIITHLAGGAVVTVNRLGLDPHHLWSQAQQHRATLLTIVGDAFARPLLKALNEARDQGNPYDISSVTTIISSGVMWSQEVKDGLLAHNDMVLIDAMGSTEGGMGSSESSRNAHASTARFKLNPNVKVFNDDNQEVTPGSGEMGMIATQSAMLGYYKDPEKTAQTVREIDGQRYVFPGDFATVDADGGITLLGRGSMCINTAGEKVFPEEVEEAIKRHGGALDCLVVGVPDERFGERVVAVVSRGHDELDDEVLLAHCREHLAGYKLPKNVLFVDEVQRAPNGKADYKWARATALERLGMNA